MPGSVQRTDNSSRATRLGEPYGSECIYGYYKFTVLLSWAKKKVNVALEQANKAQRESRSIALLFL